MLNSSTYKGKYILMHCRVLKFIIHLHKAPTFKKNITVPVIEVLYFITYESQNVENDF